MNPGVVVFVVCAAILTAVSAGCSGNANRLEKIGEMQRVSDSVTFDLRELDTTEMNVLYHQAREVRNRFKATVSNDTLELEFARHLDSFLRGIRDLNGLPAEFIRCKEANDHIRLRLRKLENDIQKGSGERARYDDYIQTEQTEMYRIRKHSVTIKRKFDTAKSAIEQYQPEIERFL